MQLNGMYKNITYRYINLHFAIDIYDMVDRKI